MKNGNRFSDAFPTLPPPPSTERRAEILSGAYGMWRLVQELSDEILWRVLVAGPKATRVAAARGLAAEGHTAEHLGGEERYQSALDLAAWDAIALVRAELLARHYGRENDSGNDREGAV